MAMKVSLEEFLGVDEAPRPSIETIAEKMALDFESSVFLRMKQLGLKQKDLADLMGITPPAVSKMLSNSSNLTLKTVAKVAFALGCAVGPITLNGVSEVNYVGLGSESETSTSIVPSSDIEFEESLFSYADEEPSGSVSASGAGSHSNVVESRRMAA